MAGIGEKLILRAGEVAVTIVVTEVATYLKKAYFSRNTDEMKEHMAKTAEYAENLKTGKPECKCAQAFYEMVERKKRELMQDDTSNRNAEYVGFKELYELLEEVAAELNLLNVLEEVFPSDLLKN